MNGSAAALTPAPRAWYHYPMPTFIDESGSADWDNAQAKDYFTLTAVWFETPEAAFACKDVIDALRGTLGVVADFEFHFTGASPNRRKAFLEAVAACNFEYVACTLRKKRQGKWLAGRPWRKRPYFYDKVIRPVVDALEGRLQQAQQNKATHLNERVTYDEKTDQVYVKSLKTHFRRPKEPKTGRSLVSKVGEGKSDVESLVQLADMICGAVVHTFDASDEYEDIVIGKRIAHIFLP